MGEKIRDVRPIHLIGGDLMVELNEGYTKSQGRVIHIQNNKFRYLLKEGDFLKVAADIMRAREELHYIKEHPPVPDIKIPECDPKEATKLSEFGFLKQLEERDVTYRVLEVRKSVVQIIVKPECHKDFRRIAKKAGLKSVAHPYGKRHGYIFLYQMKPFEMYEKNGLYYEVMCQLPCKSLTPKMWMPLDKCVQKALWTECNMVDGYPYVGEEEAWIYRVTKCIFTKMSFSPLDIAYLEERRDVLDSDTLREKLSLVVFGFADTMLEMVKQSDYEGLLQAYYGYINY